jgi:hypothetical protein
MSAEFMNRLRYAFQRALKGEAEALEIAESLAIKGFKHHLFDQVEEVRIAAQCIVIKADQDLGVGSCHGKCGINRVCAVNALIDRKVEDGQISAKLGEASKFEVPLHQIDGCRLNVDPCRALEVASYNSPRFLEG